MLTEVDFRRVCIDALAVGIESRDWYREDPPAAGREQRNGARSPSIRRGRDGRVSGGLLAAVLVSAALTGILWRFDGVAPALQERLPWQDDREVVRLGHASGFDVIGPEGKQWCLTVPSGERVCAKTGSAETGKQALKRVLEARGYRVEAAG